MKVFDTCGEPEIERTRRDANPSPEVRGTSSGRRSNKLKRGKSEFEKIIVDLKRAVKNSIGFWTKLPAQLCDMNRNGKASPLLENNCWNGNSSGTYDKSLVQDGLQYQSQNPEVHVDAQSPNPIREQILKLQSITHQLKQAHRGQNVEWWDQERDEDHSEHVLMNDDMYHGSGDDDMGSGDDEDYDDEDYANPMHMAGSGYGREGSGSSDDNHKWPWDDDEEEQEEDSKPMTTTTTSAPDIQIVEDVEEEDDETEVKTTAGGNSIRKNSSWQVLQAVIMFFLPQVVCWLPSLFI